MKRVLFALVALAASACNHPSSAPAEPVSSAGQPAVAAASAANPNVGMTKATVGAAAPDFTLTDLDGHPVTLSSFKGKTVVLEWFNPGCPFVRKAHTVG